MEQIKKFLREAILADSLDCMKEKVLSAYEYALLKEKQAVIQFVSNEVPYVIPFVHCRTVLSYRASDEKIRAIKYLREAMGKVKDYQGEGYVPLMLGLKEAKDIVEQIWERGIDG